MAYDMAYPIDLEENLTVSINTCNETKVELKPYEDFYNKAQFTTGLICYPLICFPGLIGNIFIIVVLLQKTMQTSTNIYLISLAVSDIIKLINDVLYFLTILLDYTSPVHGNKAYGYLYPYAHFLFNMPVCVSAWLTVSVAVERYILVCHPIKARDIISIKRAKILSTVIFILMTLIAVPSALRYETVTVQKCVDGENVTVIDVKITSLWEREVFVTSYAWLQALLRSIIPFFILIFMNAFIINAVRKPRRSHGNQLPKRNKITIMLIIVIIFFLICIIPDAVMSAFFNYGYAESTNYLVKGVREITDMLLGLNAAVNFIVYMIFNKLFRDEFKKLFCPYCFKDPGSEINGNSDRGSTKHSGTNGNKYTALNHGESLKLTEVDNHVGDKTELVEPVNKMSCV